VQLQFGGLVLEAVPCLNAREAMRLMGVGDNYKLPSSARGGLRIAGDGVAVPVVAWLSKHILEPLVA
jgi:DNA (cytosine-5)-methyltransferase 1